jgi:hypothetical protein
MGVGQTPVSLEKWEERHDHHAVDVIEHIEQKKQDESHTS